MAEGRDESDDRAKDAADFEEVVAALLKVDPIGIIGAEGKAARKAAPGQTAPVEE